MLATDRSMPVVDLAREAEARGFVSLYLPEHTHIPASRRTPAPTAGGVLSDDYARSVDPLVALAAAAAVTERLILGTGIALLAQREPIVTAKAVATLDQLSGGRFVLGVGYGWNREEAAHHGVEFRRRRDRVREHLRAMRSLWGAEDAGGFDGEWVQFEPSRQWPKPGRQANGRPGPPILFGGGPGPTIFRHIAELGDGWLPIGGAGVREALPALRSAAEAAGRDPESLRIVPFGTLPDAGKLAYYAELGITEVVLRVPTADADGVRRTLDGYAPFL